MKKKALGAVAIIMLAASTATAGDVHVGINLGGPPVVYEPAPVIVAPPPRPSVVYVDPPYYSGPYHFEHDRRYWAQRKRWERERWERERKERERWEREHRGYDHDRGRWHEH